MFNQLSRLDGPLFGDLSRMFRLMDDVFGDAGWSDLRSTPWGAFPSVNVGETEDAVTVYAFVPGLSREEIELSVEDNMLVIRGNRSIPTPDGSEARTSFRRERFRGEFTRAVRLPEHVNVDEVEAHLANGILTVRLRKREEMRPRRIDIKAA